MLRYAAFVFFAFVLALGGRRAVAAEADDLAAQHSQNLRASAKLIEMGDTYFKRQDAGGAIDMYERALVADPGSTAAMRKLGIAYNSVKLYSDAMKYCRMALAIEPDNVESLACQGIGAAYREQFDLAAQNLKKIKDLCKKACPEYKELRQAIRKNFPEQFKRLKQ